MQNPPSRVGPPPHKKNKDYENYHFLAVFVIFLYFLCVFGMGDLYFWGFFWHFQTRVVFVFCITPKKRSQGQGSLERSHSINARGGVERLKRCDTVGVATEGPTRREKLRGSINASVHPVSMDEGQTGTVYALEVFQERNKHININNFVRRLPG